MIPSLERMKQIVTVFHSLPQPIHVSTLLFTFVSFLSFFVLISACFIVLIAKPYTVGLKGNLCHVDCSNRGLCNYYTGICKCFEGSWGDACENISNTGGSRKTVLTFLGNDSEASFATIITEQN